MNYKIGDTVRLCGTTIVGIIIDKCGEFLKIIDENGVKYQRKDDEVY